MESGVEWVDRWETGLGGFHFKGIFAGPDYQRHYNATGSVLKVRVTKKNISSPNLTDMLCIPSESTWEKDFDGHWFFVVIKLFAGRSIGDGKVFWQHGCNGSRYVLWKIFIPFSYYNVIRTLKKKSDMVKNFE